MNYRFWMSLAYEASLAAKDKTLSRTDTWAVGCAPSMNPTTNHGALFHLSTAAKENLQAETLTTNVERILKRIAELETEISATHETNGIAAEGLWSTSGRAGSGESCGPSAPSGQRPALRGSRAV